MRRFRGGLNRGGSPYEVRSGNHVNNSEQEGRSWGSDDPEADQMARVAAGETGAALEALIDRYSSPLFGLGMRMLNDRGQAEEMVQDTFVRVWRNAGRFDRSKGSVQTFIYAIARNVAIDQIRRSSSRPQQAFGDQEDRIDTDEPFERLILGLEVREALMTLSDKHRETLELFYDEDLTQPQIAERLQIPVGTVKTRSHHALKALRKAMEVRGLAA